MSITQDGVTYNLLYNGDHIATMARTHSLDAIMKNVARLLGTVVRNRRAKLGFSQEELAFRSKLHRTYIADIERGARNPTLKTIVRLAQALSISLSDLFATLRPSSDLLQDAQDGDAERCVPD